MVGGCTNLYVPEIPSSAPTRTVRAYTEANACIGREAREFLDGRRVVLLVDKLDDKDHARGQPAIWRARQQRRLHLQKRADPLARFRQGGGADLLAPAVPIVS